MVLVLEFIRPHGWPALIVMLFANGLLCYRFGGRVLFVTIPLVAAIYGFHLNAQSAVRWVIAKRNKNARASRSLP